MIEVKACDKFQSTIPHEMPGRLGIHKGQTVTLMPVEGVLEVVPNQDISEMEGIFPALIIDGIREETDRDE